ncbi:hypothetical protein [Fulvivirga ligni]|uniref:hypothetical protein n=1 Tax=Fulvivirga ligni TaxID=2904246 RepID=UPI001F2AF09E|nr:hypothetical protein [Fulvivirga ligni]UII23364.1 hypothetical protein LVD16_09005 [Fulvivirga ligni]
MPIKILPLFLLLQFYSHIIRAQDPFEVYPAINYTTFGDWITYDRSEEQNKIHYTNTVPDFFANGDSLTIQLTTFVGQWDSSFVRIYRNHEFLARYEEPMGIAHVGDHMPLIIMDVNGDSLKDIKIVIPYYGNGIAALNVRVIYFLSQPDGSFVKVSYDDKLSENRVERDFNGDGSYEIITMTLQGYEGHNYWLYNLFNLGEDGLVTVNELYDYPIMIQLLFRENHQITKNLTRGEMKQFAHEKPKGYSISH